MSISRGRVRQSSAVVALVGIAIALGALPASAHTELRGSSPEEGATVEVLDEVRLEFSSALLDIGSELALVDSAGETHELTPEISDGADAVVAAVDSAAIAAGETVLNWRIVAEDGHPIEGVITFTYAPAAPPVADEPTASPVPVEEPAAESAPDQVPTAADELETTDAPAADEPAPEPADQTTDSESDAPSVWLWGLIALAAIALVATAVALARRRDTPTPPREGGGGSGE